MTFREYITESGARVFAGKNEKNNEELITQIKSNEYVFHTKAVGSPFVNIKGKALKKDILFARLVCAAFSKDWKKNKSNVIIHEFKGKDVYKDKKMKTGTFGVKKYKEFVVKKSKVEDFEKWQQE